MNHNSPSMFKDFSVLITTTIIIFFPFLIQKVLSSVVVHPNFQACEPQNCGNGLNITFPFRISARQDETCGYPGFEVTCKNSEPVLLGMPGNDYIIKNISYNNQSFTVVSSSGVVNQTCPVPLQNFTLHAPPIKFSPDVIHLVFFYNCSVLHFNSNVPYPVPCLTNTTHSSFAVFVPRGQLKYFNNSEFNCERLVDVPVDAEGDVSLQTKQERNYTKYLENGFTLEWTLRNNCSECQESGGRCGFYNNTFACFCIDCPHSKSCNEGNEKSYIEKKLGIGLGAGACGFLLSCFVFFIYRARFKRSSSRSFASDPYSKTGIEYGSTYCGAHIFSYTELNEATNNFDISKELGDGGFGTVYHGQLRDGRVVAVKRLFENNYKRVEQFRNEVEILTRLRHKNLVSLYGCTSHNSRELLLVYEFVSNGTVADHLHGDRSSSGMLTWPIRMSIAIETASALAYLHASDIIHRDVKTNNILLDNNCGVKVGDFGLSRPFPTNVTHVSTTPQGTPGYVDPKYYQCYQLTDKSDVYSFGVVLFELISSKPAVDICRPHHEINLSSMAVNRIQNRALHELVDPSLGFDSDCKVRRVISMVAELAYRCLQQEKEMRPSMVEVLEILKGIEREDWKVGMAEEVDIPTDDIGLLMENHQPFSSDSTTDKSTNVCSTPNTIG